MEITSGDFWRCVDCGVDNASLPDERYWSPDHRLCFECQKARLTRGGSVQMSYEEQMSVEIEQVPLTVHEPYTKAYFGKVVTHYTVTSETKRKIVRLAKAGARLRDYQMLHGTRQIEGKCLVYCTTTEQAVDIEFSHSAKWDEDKEAFKEYGPLHGDLTRFEHKDICSNENCPVYVMISRLKGEVAEGILA